MVDKFDPKMIPELFQTALKVSIGAPLVGIEMMMKPEESAGRMLEEAKTLLTIPSDAGEGIQGQVKAIAATWMERGASWMEECRAAGEKIIKED